MSKQQFKTSPVGDIPMDWECVKLESLVSSLVSGVSVSGEDRPPLNSEKMLLKVSAVTSGKFDNSAFKTVDMENGARLKRKVENNTILVNRANGSRNLVGSAVYISEVTDTLYFPDKIWKITPNSATGNGPFLGHFLSSNRFRNKVIARCSGGTGMMNIGSKSYLGIRIASPPLPEQEKIAEILGTWDRAIETQQKLIDSLTRRKKALMQQLLTGKTRLPGFEAEWLDVKLGDYFKERRERNHNNLKLLAITAKDGIVDRDSLTKTDTSNADKSKYLRITPGDIGYNTMRMWQGVSGLSTMEGIVSPAYTILKPTEDVHPEFAAYLFKLSSLIFRFKRYSQGLVDDTLSLKYTAFKIIKSSIPTTKEEQQAIAKVLTAADQEIHLHTTHLTSLRTQKRGLMQQLLTGKTRVTL